MGKDKIPDSDRKTIMDKCNELVGWITIKLQKLMNTKTNKKKQKEVVIQSLPNFINKLEDRKVECQEECLGECLVEPQEECLEVLQGEGQEVLEDQQWKKLIKKYPVQP